MKTSILRHLELLRHNVPDWTEYPFTIPAVRGLQRLEFHPAVTFLVGENGSGKSTLIEELVRWCKTHQPLEPPSSLLGRAIQYLLNHRVALMRFLDDGRLPIDNGIVERLHRRPAVGWRNYLFAGSHVGAERAAIAYSVLSSCALVGVNPIEYLADVLPHLARGVFVHAELAALAPAAWKAARATAPPSH